MFRRGKRRIWRTAALALALLWAAGPGWAAVVGKSSSSIDPLGQPVPASTPQPDSSPGIDPNGMKLWERLLLWLFGGGRGSLPAPAGRQGHGKSSGMIDPNGQPVPASTTQADSSSSIDPDGK
ncbi:MAG TPA: hypothetical protein VGP73_05045 [Thermoanaerobaculia bacterium]